MQFHGIFVYDMKNQPSNTGSNITQLIIWHFTSRGESEYKEREEDVRVLKLEVNRLRHDEAALQKSCQNMEEMKKEMLHLQKGTRKPLVSYIHTHKF